jgi:hypothetical protein
MPGPVDRARGARWGVAATAILALVSAATPRRTLADGGAFTIDVGGGGSALRVAAPFADGAPPPVTGTTAAAWIGFRRALRNDLELGVSAFWEPPVSYYHHGITISDENGAHVGTLSHQLQRYGALAGARYVPGFVWRLVVSLDLGWSHRSYSRFDQIDDSDPANPRSTGLALPDFTTDNFVVAPGIGVEWVFADHWTLGLVPRAEVLLGPDRTWGVTVPVVLGWSWYP